MSAQRTEPQTATFGFADEHGCHGLILSGSAIGQMTGVDPGPPECHYTGPPTGHGGPPASPETEDGIARWS